MDSWIVQFVYLMLTCMVASLAVFVVYDHPALQMIVAGTAFTVGAMWSSARKELKEEPKNE